MKKILYSLLTIIAALVITSCEQEKLQTETKTTGEVDFTTLIVRYDASAEIMRAVDVDNFIISVYESNGTSKLAEWSYGSMPEVFTLTAGSYLLKAESCVLQNAAWDTPYYFAQKEFKVEVDKVTAIGEVVCELSNVKVTIEYSSDLLAVMGDDCKVNIALGRGSLDFGKNESRAGYFAVTEESNRMYAYFTGSVDGVVDTTYREIENVKAGEWRILKYSLKQNNTENVENGAFALSLSVDVSCSVVEQNNEIDVTEDVIDDPEGGNNDNPKPDDPQPVSGPVITATTFDIKEPQIISDELVIVVEVNSESPLAGFYVDIVSATLTPDELEAVGLSSHLDLAYPGDLRPQLEGLGFPVAENVLGQNKISFDITQFAGLLAALGSGTHQFVMTATDEAGNETIETLTLIAQ
ncbi:MAG: DUF4493 domain-containing protein [Bacteroidaceae bacterium]|nr:DUF4493 domain-containing protein [Bacteroidaceae bacterium]